MDRCNSQKPLDSSQRKVDLQLSFCVNTLNLGVKPYPYILYCYINNSSVKYLSLHILHYWMNTDQKYYKVLRLDDIMIAIGYT